MEKDQQPSKRANRSALGVQRSALSVKRSALSVKR